MHLNFDTRSDQTNDWDKEIPTNGRLYDLVTQLRSFYVLIHKKLFEFILWWWAEHTEDARLFTPTSSFGPAECPSRAALRIPTKMRDPLHMLSIHQITPAPDSFHHRQENRERRGCTALSRGTLRPALRDGHAPV